MHALVMIEIANSMDATNRPTLVGKSAHAEVAEVTKLIGHTETGAKKVIEMMTEKYQALMDKHERVFVIGAACDALQRMLAILNKNKQRACTETEIAEMQEILDVFFAEYSPEEE